MPSIDELWRTRRDQGLVLIGLHTEREWEKMERYVAENDIGFPVCVDVEDTIKAWGADTFPDYAIVDRQGILRVADLANGAVEEAVESLLGEWDHLSAAAARAFRSPGTYESAVFDFLMADGTNLGTFELGGLLDTVDDERVLAWSTALRLQLPGDDDVIELSFSGASVLGPRLTPRHLTLTDDDGRRREAEVAVASTGEGATWSLAWADDEPDLEVPAGTLLDMALFHLAPGLPEEEGFAFEAPWLELEDADLRGYHRVENHGRVELEHRGETVKAWHWVVSDVERDGGPHTRLELWTAKGELLEVDFDGKRLVRRAAE